MFRGYPVLRAHGRTASASNPAIACPQNSTSACAAGCSTGDAQMLIDAGITRAPGFSQRRAWA